MKAGNAAQRSDRIRSCVIRSLHVVALPASINASGFHENLFNETTMYTTPLAYFITFTTRGSWLHGDTRGSVTKNGQFIAPNEHWVRSEMQNLNDPPLLLSPEQRSMVEQALRELCLKRHWSLHEVNVRSNHIHIVVTAVEIKPEKVMSDLKAKATRRLRKMKIISDTQKPWTERGSTRYLFTQEEFDNACHYVKDCQ